MAKSLMFLLLLCVLQGRVFSLDELTYPTLRAIQETRIPANDRLDLAQRFLGLANRTTSVSPASPDLGERAQFYVMHGYSEGGLALVEAELLALGEHILVWAEVGIAMDRAEAQAFAELFDTQIYSPVLALWQTEIPLGIDGDSRIYALFSDQVEIQIGAYFAGQNSQPRYLVAQSNEHEMLVFNNQALGGDYTGAEALGYASHELQHLLRYFVNLKEQAWVDEAFSMITQEITGFNHGVTGLASAFMNAPETPLTHWGLNGLSSRDYGAGYLFALYFYEHYGIEGLREWGNLPYQSLASLDAVLAHRNQPAADYFFADWVLANAVRDPATGYGYRTLSADVASVATETITVIPYKQSEMLAQYATHYYELSTPPEMLTIELQLADTIGLIADAPPRGEWFWYSQRGDELNPRLTHAFDLRTITIATLDFQIWYELEEFWDYAYVSVSRDGGQTWSPLPTRYTTTGNPNGKAYGVGYTGASGGWLADSADLSPYAGQEILVRFEMVTDDSLHLAGFAVDDVQIEALGYADAMESESSDWVSEGWIRTDNRLPQQAWVQVIEFSPNTPARISRWLAHGSAEYPLVLADTTASVVLAISPFAPMTALEVPYRLEVR